MIGADRSASGSVAAAYERISADGRDGIWIEVVDRDVALAHATRVDERVTRGDHVPLAGRTVAVKGNIDVEGVDTTAGCPAFAYRPTRSAAAVRALTGAGAVVVGVTNLDQFATGLVGTRSPYGICPNAHWDGLVSGGSSSGSAVAVAAGLVDLALGTDTAGSGRVPAAANGIVGLKATKGRISTSGVVPACASIDCVSVFARSVDEAALAVSIAAGPDPQDPWSRTGALAAPTDGELRVGVPLDHGLTFDGEADGAERFAAAAAAVPGRRRPADVESLLAAGRLLYEGAFVAERYSAVGPFVDAHRDQVDPVVGAIISDSGRLPAWQFAQDLTTLAELRRDADALFRDIDVLVVPSLPRVPTVAQVLAEPVAVNSMLGTYTNFVNLLDLCALTLPVPTPMDTSDRPPTSVTIIAPAWHDDVVVEAARRIARAPQPR